MSDSRRVYRAIRGAVKQLYPQEPQGNLARHLNTLAGMVTGIVLGKSCQLPKMAAKVPEAAKPDSREKRFSRLVQNAALTADIYFLPLVRPLLTNLARQRPMVFVMDGQCRRAGLSGAGGQRAVCPPGVAHRVVGRSREQGAFSSGNAHSAAASGHGPVALGNNGDFLGGRGV